MSSRPSHHEMVHSLRPLAKGNMEELARNANIPVGRLWDAWHNEDVNLARWGRALEAYYYMCFPEALFDPFVERRDRKLEDAFQQAVASSMPDPTALRELIEDDWTWLSTWKYEIDEPGVEYLGARYALTALWTNIRLAPDIDQKKAFEVINDKCVRGKTALRRTPDRPLHAGLMMRFTRLQISAAQRYHLLFHKKYLPVTKTVPEAELRELLEYLVAQIKSWKKGHFARWQRARDAVTIASGLSKLEECCDAYKILLEERPEFKNLNHQKWTVGSAADDPDLKFFRENFDKICTLIEERSKSCAA
jgi:hypothetical protein